MDKRIDFKRIKLLSVGDYKNDKNGKPTIKVTEKVLDGMIEAFNDFKNNTLPDVIIDHKDTKEQRDKAFTIPDDKGKPKEVFGRLPFSVGKIDNLIKIGKDLYGDFINVFEPIKNALTDKLLTSLSSEFFLDIKSNVTGKNYDGVLTAVAILPGGTWAELYDKFKPYMFNLDDTNQLQKFSLESFESENKVICKLQDFEKGTSQMSEKDYQKKMQKFMDKKMKCASYQEFMGMDETQQQEYMSMMEDKYKKFSLSEYGEVNQMPNQEPVKFSIEDLVKRLDSQQEENNELKKQLFSLVNKTDEKVNEENRLLKEQIQAITRAEKTKEVIKFVNDKLIDSNKFDPADREMLENGLTSLAMLSNEPVKFSVSGNENVLSVFDFVVNLLEKVPSKVSFSHNAIVASEGEFKVYSNELTDNKDKDSVILMKKAKHHFSLQGKTIDQVKESDLEEFFKSQNAIA